MSCRCPGCVPTNPGNGTQLPSKEAAVQEHGYNQYTYGCRCEVCKRAKADYMRARRAAARAKAQKFTDDRGRHFVPDITHGRFGYEERGCRCPGCMEARAEDARKQYLRNVGMAA